MLPAALAAGAAAAAAATDVACGWLLLPLLKREAGPSEGGASILLLLFLLSVASLTCLASRHRDHCSCSGASRSNCPRARRCAPYCARLTVLVCLRSSPPPRFPSFVLIGHAASFTPY